jgi:hypothetical protein
LYGRDRKWKGDGKRCDVGIYSHRQPQDVAIFIRKNGFKRVVYEFYLFDESVLMILGAIFEWKIIGTNDRRSLKKKFVIKFTLLFFTWKFMGQPKTRISRMFRFHRLG